MPEDTHANTAATKLFQLIGVCQKCVHVHIQLICFAIFDHKITLTINQLSKMLLMKFLQ